MSVMCQVRKKDLKNISPVSINLIQFQVLDYCEDIKIVVLNDTQKII